MMKSLGMAQIGLIMMVLVEVGITKYVLDTESVLHDNYREENAIEKDTTVTVIEGILKGKNAKKSIEQLVRSCAKKG